MSSTHNYDGEEDRPHDVEHGPGPLPARVPPSQAQNEDGPRDGRGADHTSLQVNLLSEGFKEGAPLIMSLSERMCSLAETP